MAKTGKTKLNVSTKTYNQSKYDALLKHRHAEFQQRVQERCNNQYNGDFQKMQQALLGVVQTALYRESSTVSVSREKRSSPPRRVQSLDDTCTLHRHNWYYCNRTGAGINSVQLPNDADDAGEDSSEEDNGIFYIFLYEP